VAGFVIAVVAALLPFVLGALGLGRIRIMVIGGALALAWLVALASKPASDTNAVPFWYLGGMVILLYGIWCGGLWLGAHFRRIRQATPG
jgi:hypothetical protein